MRLLSLLCYWSPLLTCCHMLLQRARPPLARPASAIRYASSVSIRNGQPLPVHTQPEPDEFTTAAELSALVADTNWPGGGSAR